MPSRVLITGPPAVTARLEAILRPVHRVTVVRERERALAMTRVGGFDAIVTAPGHLGAATVDGPVVVAAADLDADALLARVAEATAVGRDAELAHANASIELGTLAYDEYLELVRDAATRRYLIVLLATYGGSVTAAARAAGLVRESLHRLLRRHGLDAESFRGR